MKYGRFLAFAALLVGCSGAARDCSSYSATEFGADWVVVQVDLTGHAFRCWELKDTAITNEPHSDGVFWEDSHSHNLVHISGTYNRVQVTENRWNDAFSSLGLTRQSCADIRTRLDVSPGFFESNSDAGVP